MKKTLQDDDLAEKFIPDYSVGCQRITPCPGYLEVYAVLALDLHILLLTKNNRLYARPT